MSILYAYRCAECGHCAEIRCRIEERNSQRCPNCASSNFNQRYDLPRSINTGKHFEPSRQPGTDEGGTPHLGPALHFEGCAIADCHNAFVGSNMRITGDTLKVSKVDNFLVGSNNQVEFDSIQEVSESELPSFSSKADD